MLLSKVQSNKQEKEQCIENAAFELFTKTSFHETSIDQIVKKANVAKGTFYLYFKDKEQLLHHLIYQKSSDLLRDALQKAETQKIDNHIERIVFLIDYVIEYLKENKDVLKIINRNLSWSMMGKAIKGEKDKEIERAVSVYATAMIADGHTKEDSMHILFMLIELTSTVCHSSILLGEPSDIDTMKPLLFMTIRKMLMP